MGGNEIIGIIVNLIFVYGCLKIAKGIENEEINIESFLIFVGVWIFINWYIAHMLLEINTLFANLQYGDTDKKRLY